jgi:glutamyl aminopeptidase
VTYRETNLLYDRAVSSTANKQRIAAVIGHGESFVSRNSAISHPISLEFAHMWFGNLVTMKWWSDLWLNEGFASYIEFKGINAAWPEWKMEDQFTVDTMHSIMNLDATLGSHPIIVGVETPDQITEIFDGITYNKGASIIRMMEDFIGAENFRAGVSAYLDANKYLNADSNDLLKHLEGKIPEDVTAILNTWIRQKGLPVVTVEATSGNFKLTQTRFLTDPEASARETVDSEYNYKWSIPITYTTSANPTDVQRLWFHHTSNEIVIPVAPSSVDWVKVNKDQVGYYRVKYEQSMWQSLNKALETNIDTMSVLDRAHLLNDAFSLAEAIQVPYSTALTMTKYLKQETHFVPWDVASSKLKNIRSLLYYTEHYQKFREYVVDLVDAAYTSISIDVNPDEHLKK